MYYIISTNSIEDFFNETDKQKYFENTKFFVLQATRNKKDLFDELNFTLMLYWTYENIPLNVAIMSDHYYFSNISNDYINHHRIYHDHTNAIPQYLPDDKYPLLPKKQRLCEDFETIENKISELIKNNFKEKGIIQIKL